MSKASTSRPVIGVTCCRRTLGAEAAQAVVDRYVEGITRHANCGALLIPARPDLMSARELCERIDGLLLTGSPSNVQPQHYGGNAEDGAEPFDPYRDQMSLAAIDAMVELGRPIFGICRGFQELNVAFGGSLQQGLANPSAGLSHHAPDEAALDQMFAHRHQVALSPNGILARELDRQSLEVTSVHYQGIDRLGNDLRVEARAPDGLVEAVSAHVNGATVLGVQWHPEWQTDQDVSSVNLFALFGRLLRGEKRASQEVPLT